MSHVTDLNDLNGCQEDYYYADSPDYENNLIKTDSNNELLSEDKPDLLLDNNAWTEAFDTDKGGKTRLVSSEEDIISLNGSPNLRRGNGHGSESTGFENHRNNESEMDTNDDGFASQDVLTIACDPVSNEGSVVIGVLDSQVSSMADHWGNTEYETVLRTNVVDKTRKSKDCYVNPSLVKNKVHRNGTNKDNICTTCHDKVYVPERTIFNRRLYHSKCFKCSVCNSAVGMTNVASISNKLYCTVHFKDAINKLERPNAVIETSSSTVLEELPPQQNTKRNVEMFRQLESRKETVVMKTKRPDSRKPYRFTPCANLTPVNREDNNGTVAHSINELPIPGSTQMLLNIWNTVNTPHKSTVAFNSLACEHKIKLNMSKESMKLTETDVRDAIDNDINTRDFGDVDSSVIQTEEIGQYAQISSPIPYAAAPITSSSATENVCDSSTITDTMDTKYLIAQFDELPAEGLTRNLVGFFQALHKD